MVVKKLHLPASRAKVPTPQVYYNISILCKLRLSEKSFWSMSAWSDLRIYVAAWSETLVCVVLCEHVTRYDCWHAACFILKWVRYVNPIYPTSPHWDSSITRHNSIQANLHIGLNILLTMFPWYVYNILCSYICAVA